MAISKYKGEQLYPLLCTGAKQLEPFRVAKITNGQADYPGRGEEAVGKTGRVRGEEDNDYAVNIMPFDFVTGTFFLDLAASVSANELLFPCGTDGKVRSSKGTVQSRSIDASGETPESGTKYIVPADMDWDGNTDNANSVATYTSSYAVEEPETDDIYYVADEGVYVIWNGTAWVEVKGVCYSDEAGSAGERITCKLEKSISKVGYEQLDSSVKSTYKIVAGGTISLSAATSGTANDDRIAAGDFVQATIQSNDGNSSITKVVTTENTVTVTVSASTTGVIFYTILRACS